MTSFYLNVMDRDDGLAISVTRTFFRENDFRDAHRDEGHSFYILEQGTVDIEIDFRQYRICAPSVVYMHPTQVHRIIHFENITICSLSMKDENLNPDSVRLPEDMAPAEPLVLTAENNRTLFHIFELCLLFSSQKNNTLHGSLQNTAANACNLPFYS